ncbi:phospholipase D-like domain-containing protein [Agrobacterium vitis]|uniref:phospholipase D-like domain-containing protein n=1 Tax=Agrobacterium vitis TaxID=373 RepID=UPI0012E7B860|nr:phospholipase D-like domain-containing protein [Agrobacterium vitis]MVA25761.1 phospholipase [Agrobacterium vitis]
MQGFEKASSHHRNGSDQVIRVGHNAWKTGVASKAGFLIDGAQYFRALADALSRAQEQIFIIGWDFNPDIQLIPEDQASPTLGEFLISLVDNNSRLSIHILVWAMGPIYSGKSLRMLGKTELKAHPRIDLRLDTRHAVRGSHHQKMVVIDDALAFIGGIDLTAKRWDTPEHRADQPLRRTPKGERYEPVHDVQMAVDGEAAEVAAEIARRRWWQATGEDLVRPRCYFHSFPPAARYVLRNCDIAFARTEPAIRRSTSVRETLQLTLDCLSRAERLIYIESQYFASKDVADLLAARLSEPDGPEVVLISTLNSHGFLERKVLGENRDRMIRKLRQADRFGRFRAFYPVVPDESRDDKCEEVLVHAKLIIVDDVFIRVGSSNLNQRSVGLDTELDVAIEMHSDKERQILTDMRNGLLGEHLGLPSADLAKAQDEAGSLVRALDRVNIGARGLRSFPVGDEHGKTSLHFATGLVDPKAPWWPLQLVSIPFSMLKKIRRMAMSKAGLSRADGSQRRMSANNS